MPEFAKLIKSFALYFENALAVPPKADAELLCVMEWFQGITDPSSSGSHGSNDSSGNMGSSNSSGSVSNSNNKGSANGANAAAMASASALQTATVSAQEPEPQHHWGSCMVIDAIGEEAYLALNPPHTDKGAFRHCTEEKNKARSAAHHAAALRRKLWVVSYLASHSAHGPQAPSTATATTAADSVDTPHAHALRHMPPSSSASAARCAEAATALLQRDPGLVVLLRELLHVVSSQQRSAAALTFVVQVKALSERVHHTAAATTAAGEGVTTSTAGGDSGSGGLLELLLALATVKTAPYPRPHRSGSTCTSALEEGQPTYTQVPPHPPLPAGDSRIAGSSSSGDSSSSNSGSSNSSPPGEIYFTVRPCLSDHLLWRTHRTLRRAIAGSGMAVTRAAAGGETLSIVPGDSACEGVGAGAELVIAEAGAPFRWNRDGTADALGSRVHRQLSAICPIL